MTTATLANEAPPALSRGETPQPSERPARTAGRVIQRALLINPPSGLYRRDDRCQCKVEDQTVAAVFPPMDLAYGAAAMRQQGVDVVIRDYPAQGAAWKDYLQDLRTLKPDLLLFNATTATIELDMQAALAAREHCPDLIIIANGEYLNYFGEKLMRERPEIDHILHGEIEETLRDLAEGKPPVAVPGLWCRNENGDPVKTPSRPFMRDIDALPFPARDLLDNAIYRSPENGRPMTVIYGNRGCHAKCIYCPAGVLSGFQVRLRNPQRVVDEIEECVTKHGVRDFLFHGDTFTFHKKWVMELCQEILDRKLDIHWGCNSRVDTWDDERAAMMKKAGCWVVAFGFEHGDQELLDKMKKGATVEKAYEAADICRRNGLCVQAFLVMGLPWETEKTLETLKSFMLKLDPDFFDFNIAYPLPGTELYEIAMKENLIEVKDLAEAGYARAAMRTFTLSPDFLTAWRRKTLLRMTLRPKYVARTLWRATKTGTLPYYVKEGTRRVTRLVRAS